MATDKKADLRPGERGSALLEKLAYVAIIGTLFVTITALILNQIGIGEEEARKTEHNNIQTAVAVMMVDNNLPSIPNKVMSPTNDMSAFPDTTTAHGNSGVGYVLFGHDRNGDSVADTNYTYTKLTKWMYTILWDGTVIQHNKAPD